LLLLAYLLPRKPFTKPLPSNVRLQYSSLQASCQIAPSLRLFVVNGLQAYHHFFFSEGCACNVCAWFHHPSHGSVFPWSLTSLLSNCCRCYLLKTARPKSSLIGCQSVQVYHHHLPLVGAIKSSESGQCSYIYDSYSKAASRLFFCFGGIQPLHYVRTLIIQSAHFMTFNSRVCMQTSYNVSWFSHT
jgi:hypothetical protein